MANSNKWSWFKVAWEVGSKLTGLITCHFINIYQVYGGFHKWGIVKMVGLYIMENPINMDDRGTPISGKLNNYIWITLPCCACALDNVEICWMMRSSIWTHAKMQPHQHPDPKRLKNVQFQGWGAYILTFTAGVAYWVILNPHSKWLPYFTQILKICEEIYVSIELTIYLSTYLSSKEWDNHFLMEYHGM